MRTGQWERQAGTEHDAPNRTRRDAVPCAERFSVPDGGRGERLKGRGRGLGLVGRGLHGRETAESTGWRLLW